MNRSEILEDFFFIERGYLNANHFVLRSDRPELIDTGYLGDYEETRARIEALGVTPARVARIVSTHCHCDHIGGNRRIQEASGCSVALHAIGKHFIDHRDDWSTWWRYYGQAAEFFDRIEPLHDGETIRIGPHPFEVIHTPGHAADLIALYHRRDRILISSDALWENDVAVVTERVEGSRALFDMHRSLERLRALDVRIVYPGHGRPFTGFQESIDRSCDRVRQFMENREKIGDDMLKKIVVYTLMMHRKASVDDFFAMLMATPWFPETVDFYFKGDYAGKFDETIRSLEKRMRVRIRNGMFSTGVRP